MLDKVTYDAKYKNQLEIKNLYEDSKAIKRFLGLYSSIKQLATCEGNIDIIDICMDVDKAIKDCKFNSTQQHRLKLWMLGYKEYEIADMLGVSRVLIHNFLNNASLKISEKLMR